MTASGVLPDQVARRYPHGYAVVDVETSGLSPRHHRVLQIAVTQLNSGGGIEHEWSTLLDPGCDPGPVHIHGLTRERLAGSPLFPDVLATVRPLLEGRVLVAHNARFDWQFLSAEADRSNVKLPVQFRLCTIALSRRLDLPLTGMSLDVVAAYWGVPRVRAHDALDDTRVLVEVLRHSLVVADRLQVTLPLAACDAMPAARSVPPSAPRPTCPWKYAGRWTPGQPLRQGMKVVFTGDTTRSRELLIRDAAAAGLDVMNNVSSRTSLLVRNAGGVDTRKFEAARQHDTAIVDEATWTTLFASIAPGLPRTATPTTPPAVAPTGEPSASPPRKSARAAGRLAKHRVLVVGGPHAAAVAVRERVVELGGQAAANLTASVTHVVLLDNASSDPRFGKVTAAGLPQLDPTTLDAVASATPAHADGLPKIATDAAPIEPIVLGHGVVTDLPNDIDNWSLAIAWQDNTYRPITLDVVALVVDEDEQVRDDEDFCFYNQPAHPTGAVDLDLNIPNEALAVIRPSQLPNEQRRIVFAAAIDGDATFGHVGPIELALRTPSGELTVRATLDAATSERSMLLATLYNRNGTWRLRAIGQGYDTGLAHLAVLHGVDIED